MGQSASKKKKEQTDGASSSTQNDVSGIDRLVDLFNALALPTAPPVESRSFSSYCPSPSMVRAHIRKATLRPSNAFREDIDSDLIKVADIIAPSPSPTAPFNIDLIKNNFRFQSADAHAAGSQSGEVGLTSFFLVFFCAPVNSYIRTILGNTGHKLEWQMVGASTPGQNTTVPVKPDIRLRWEFNSVFQGILATIEYKSPTVLTDTLMEEIHEMLLKKKLFATRDGTIAEKGYTRTPRRNRSKPCKILDQALIQMFSTNASYCFISNYNYILPIYWDQSSGNLRLDILTGDLIHITTPSTSQEPAASAIGLFVGISLRTLAQRDPALRASLGL